ncbi:hypothetical protein NHX12_014332 [Muraenolepis orangiensis]|uniref:Uncharacterized protein n=1 Tax=Muraenolepis orangiensis TaxID=630683 RepID=A0A9Q0I5J1_9TELE|nr:hypothetical protein NHX12_014332 [Muraenolepis orangiensis]
MDTPGNFETVAMDGLNHVDLSPSPASNGAYHSGQGESMVSLVLPPPSGCFPLDTEQMDKKCDQSDSEEEQVNSNALSCGSTSP